MAFTNANRRASDAAARSTDDLGRSRAPSNSQHFSGLQALRAELVGDTCGAAGIVGRCGTPVLNHPSRAVEIYRNGLLALRIRSIGETARLTVKSAGHGPPIFCVDERASGSPMRSRKVAPSQQGQA